MFYDKKSYLDIIIITAKTLLKLYSLFTPIKCIPVCLICIESMIIIIFNSSELIVC